MSIFTVERPNLSVESQNFVYEMEAKGGPPPYELAPETVRQNLIDAQAGVLVVLPEVDIKDES